MPIKILISVYPIQEAGCKQKTLSESLRGLNKLWQLPTLPHCCVVPSAMRGLTSLFGMGRGEHPRQNHHKKMGLS